MPLSKKTRKRVEIALNNKTSAKEFCDSVEGLTEMPLSKKTRRRVEVALAQQAAANELCNAVDEQNIDLGDFAGAGLTAHYTFQDTSQRIVTDQKGSLDLTVHGYPTTEPGAVHKVTRGWNPAGHATVVESAWAKHTSATAVSNVFRGAAWTVSVWVKINYTHYNGGGYVLSVAPASGSDYFNLWWDTSRFRASSNNWDSSHGDFAPYFQDTDEPYHHLVIRYREGIYLDTWADGVELRHGYDFQPYVDGWAGSTGATRLVVGGYNPSDATTSMNQVFSGAMDDLRIYSTALSDAQIATLYDLKL